MQKEKLSLKERIHIFGKALKISMQTKTTGSHVVAILGFAAAFLPVAISKLLQIFTDTVQAIFGNGTERLPMAFGIFGCMSCLYIVQLMYHCLRDYYQYADSLRVRKYINETALRHTCTVKYKYLENEDDYKEKIRLVTDSSGAGYKVAESMSKITGWFQYLITFISIVAVISAISPWISVMLLIATIPAVILAYIQNDESYRSKTKWMPENARAIRYYAETNIPEVQNDVRFFGMREYMKEERSKVKTRFLRKKNEITRKHVLYNSVADILRNSVYIIILLITAKQVFDNPALGLGAFMLVFTIASEFQSVIAKLLIGAVQFIGDIQYMKDFFDLDKIEHESVDPQAKPYDEYDIAFHNVRFVYPNTERDVLRDINVTIKSGEKIAIVGENGSGKSTFISLLCGLYTPTNGKVEIAGKNIKDDLSRTRATISAIFQEFGQYETTIRENIAISDMNKPMDDGEIKKLANQVEANDFIENQPDGLDEVIGEFSEKGNNLSGGQWQKLAILRAAYRDKAKIMILDEPTAALDPIAEAALYQNFSSLTKERTTLLISHRLGITKLVDRILVFHEGEIVEDGSHDELLGKNGKYAELYQAQAQWYQ